MRAHHRSGRRLPATQPHMAVDVEELLQGRRGHDLLVAVDQALQKVLEAVPPLLQHLGRQVADQALGGQHVLPGGPLSGEAAEAGTTARRAGQAAPARTLRMACSLTIFACSATKSL